MLNPKPSYKSAVDPSIRMPLRALEDARSPGHLEAAANLSPGFGVMRYSLVR